MTLCQMAFKKVVEGLLFKAAVGTQGKIPLILLHPFLDLVVQLIHRVQGKVKLGELVVTAFKIGTSIIVPSAVVLHAVRPRGESVVKILKTVEEAIS